MSERASEDDGIETDAGEATPRSARRRRPAQGGPSGRSAGSGTGSRALGRSAGSPSGNANAGEGHRRRGSPGEASGDRGGKKRRRRRRRRPGGGGGSGEGGGGPAGE
ncbi:MAG: hypothetical protein R3B49_00380 [Phycisphaerales bacterium]